ncbi:sugar porter family MFS transporter [Pedobacter sp.]|uniref:sugar porter family MFS transporter n=1 Tax=Pedobacter sp. TaxID=1411316 RepID=UPI002BA92FF2|nr:sugar porter family MFS transporter [Pedobacter sp.]HWW39848.1 sugar porter family MFS transporter [Pedobacter sp.]
MNKKNVFLWSLVIALGGFLFGFDTAVISGAEQSIQKYWDLNTVQHGLTVSIALIGTVTGALLGAIPSDRLGRKKTLYLIAFLYFISSLGTAFSTNWYIFLFFRFIGGFGVGASSVTAPIYISEISPADRRGKLVGLFQFNVVLGIVVSYFSNYLISLTGGNSWRLMLGIQSIPSAIFFLLLRFVPESPRWLIMKKGKVEEAREIFKIINPATADTIINEIQQTDKQEKELLQTDPLFSKRYRTPVMLAILFAAFNQVSGINAIIYYSPRIFEMTGLGTSSSLLSTAGLGAINFTFTLLAMNFIDRVGRRTLMLIGSFGLIVTLAMVSYSFYKENFSGWAVPVFLFIYIAFFAFSQGAVIWVFISEIFPNQVRAKGQTLGSTTHWIMAAFIAFSFPYLAEKAGGGNTFLFFCIMMCIQLIFVWKIMPETKGKSLEQIEHTLVLH